MIPFYHELVQLRIHQFVVLLLMVLSASTAFAQESEYVFTWHNQAEEKQAGNLKIEVLTNPDESEIVLNLRVEWHNSGGQIITKSENKPLLYLSDYDFETPGNTSIFCKTFTDTDKNDLFFKDDASLVFGYLPEAIDQVEFKFKFQYAFSEEDIFSAKTRVIGLPSGTRLTLRIPASRLKQIRDLENQKIDLANNQQVLSYCTELDSCIIDLQNKSEALQQVIDSLDYQHIITQLDTELSSQLNMDSLRISQIKSELYLKLTESDRLMSEIDRFFPEIRALENMLSSDHIPTDSILSYQGRTDIISRRIKAFKSDFLDYRRHIRALQDNLGVKTIPNDLDDQRVVLEEIYVPKFESQIDSLKDVRLKHEVLLLDLDPILADLPSKALGNSELDSLINSDKIFFIEALLLWIHHHRDDNTVGGSSSYDRFQLGRRHSVRAGVCRGLWTRLQSTGGRQTARGNVGWPFWTRASSSDR